MAKAAADFLVLKSPTVPPDAVFHTPPGVSDAVASTLPVAGLTAAAALSAIGRRSGDTVLIGGAAGGVEYGLGLADRVRALAPGGVTAATNLFGTETAEAALALGIPPERISTIAAGPNPPGGVRATGGSEADLDDMERITDAILAGRITVPIAATFPIEQTRDAVTLQARRHVHGKIVITV